MMVDLKPCPFCGCAPVVDGDKIVCPERHCWGPIVEHYDSIDDAAEAWNRRALSPAMEPVAWADRPMEVSAMRELPRDLVTILRTEAKNQRTPPIDYVIAEDGGRMVHTPDPDIAMAELLEEAASALAAERAAREKAEAQLAEARKALEPFARLEIPRKPQGNAGAYSILHENIRAARALEAQGGENG